MRRKLVINLFENVQYSYRFSVVRQSQIAETLKMDRDTILHSTRDRCIITECENCICVGVIQTYDMAGIYRQRN